jgi:hypothetical protein
MSSGDPGLLFSEKKGRQSCDTAPFCRRPSKIVFNKSHSIDLALLNILKVFFQLGEIFVRSVTTFT